MKVSSIVLSSVRRRVAVGNWRNYSSATTAPADPVMASVGGGPSIQVHGKTFTTDKWFNVPENVLSAASRRLHLQKDHPISITRQIIEAQFPAPTFRHFNDLHPVVSTEQNFDSLMIPPDHPGRAPSDTYYLNETTLLRTHTSAHEANTFRANLSDGYLISADVYRRDAIDRSHYPVFHQMEGARTWDRKVLGNDLAAAVWDDLSKLPKHDMTVEDPNPTVHPERNPLQEGYHSLAEAEAIAAHLKRSLELLVVDIFTRAKAAARLQEVSRSSNSSSSSSGEKEAAALVVEDEEPLRVRWVEAYFPFTSPSWELEVYYAGDWLEVLGCGVSRQEIPDRAGVPSRSGWAFGVGLDRIAMLLFRIPDIRLFWSRDDRFLAQFAGVSDDPSRIRRFVEFSKHPPCYKDVSFWLRSPSSSSVAGDGGSSGGVGLLGTATTTPKPNAQEFHENDVMEVVRGVAGDLAEDVQLADSFVHPRTGRRSLCYRVNYRSLERTLTNTETNDLHDRVSRELVAKLGVEIR